MRKEIRGRGKKRERERAQGKEIEIIKICFIYAPIQHHEHLCLLLIYTNKNTQSTEETDYINKNVKNFDTMNTCFTNLSNSKIK